MRAIGLLAVALLVATATAETVLYRTSLPPRNWLLQPGLRSDRREVIEMTIGLRRRNMDKAEELFWKVSDPRSEMYGDHLNNKAITELTSPGPVAISKVLSWLDHHGVESAKVNKQEDYITFSAPIAVIEGLLGAQFHVYKNTASGMYINRALSSVRLPDEIAQLVEVIGGHRGFPLPKKLSLTSEHAPPATTSAPTATAVTATPVPTTPAPAPTYMNVTPEVIRKAYNVSWIPKTPEGTYNLQSFFQAQAQYVEPSDMQQFCQGFMAPKFANCSISRYIGPNVGTEPGLESSLDSEYIFAMSEGTETWAYSYANFDFCGDLMHWARDVFDHEDEKHPFVISMSYGSQAVPNYCTGPDVDRLSKDVMKMGLMGISVLIASGDQGSGEYSRIGYNEGLLGPSMPASIPFCTAVGATTFVQNVNYGQEEATNAFGSGGGFSFDYAQPDYQRDAVHHFLATSDKLPQALSFNRTGRATPDVSALGWNFTVVSGGSLTAVGGTSCSTPTMSGMITLLNNIRLKNKKTLGFLNLLFYQNTDAFTDIVAGNNDINSDGFGWYCNKGWDPATGIGTLNFGRMAEVIESINTREAARGGDRKVQL